jgi:hypothetical protein
MSCNLNFIVHVIKKKKRIEELLLCLSNEIWESFYW